MRVLARPAAQGVEPRPRCAPSVGRGLLFGKHCPANRTGKSFLSAGIETRSSRTLNSGRAFVSLLCCRRTGGAVEATRLRVAIQFSPLPDRSTSWHSTSPLFLNDAARTLECSPPCGFAAAELCFTEHLSADLAGVSIAAPQFLYEHLRLPTS